MNPRLSTYLIRQGLIKPRNLAETRAVFPFPEKLIKISVRGIAISRSMEALHYVNKGK